MIGNPHLHSIQCSVLKVLKTFTLGHHSLPMVVFQQQGNLQTHHLSANFREEETMHAEKGEKKPI